jgi:hypothetical protein
MGVKSHLTVYGPMKIFCSLASGDIGVLHFLFNNYKRSKWLRRFHQLPLSNQIGNYLRAKPLGEPVMQMNELLWSSNSGHFVKVLFVIHRCRIPQRRMQTP